MRNHYLSAAPGGLDSLVILESLRASRGASVTQNSKCVTRAARSSSFHVPNTRPCPRQGGRMGPSGRSRARAKPRNSLKSPASRTSHFRYKGNVPVSFGSDWSFACKVLLWRRAMGGCRAWVAVTVLLLFQSSLSSATPMVDQASPLLGSRRELGLRIWRSESDSWRLLRHCADVKGVAVIKIWV